MKDRGKRKRHRERCKAEGKRKTGRVKRDQQMHRNNRRKGKDGEKVEGSKEAQGKRKEKDRETEEGIDRGTGKTEGKRKTRRGKRGSTEAQGKQTERERQGVRRGNRQRHSESRGRGESPTDRVEEKGALREGLRTRQAELSHTVCVVCMACGGVGTVHELVVRCAGRIIDFSSSVFPLPPPPPPPNRLPPPTPYAFLSPHQLLAVPASVQAFAHRSDHSAAASHTRLSTRLRRLLCLCCLFTGDYIYIYSHGERRDCVHAVTTNNLQSEKTPSASL